MSRKQAGGRPLLVFRVGADGTRTSEVMEEGAFRKTIPGGAPDDEAMREETKAPTSVPDLQNLSELSGAEGEGAGDAPETTQDSILETVDEGTGDE